MTEHAVVIAGGGPTGMMLAGELTLGGVDVAIVERRAAQTLVGNRAGGLHARTLEIFDQRGIVDRLARISPDPERVHVSRVANVERGGDHGVEHAVHRRVERDRQRKRQNDDGGEHRLLAQRAGTESKGVECELLTRSRYLLAQGVVRGPRPGDDNKVAGRVFDEPAQPAEVDQHVEA